MSSNKIIEKIRQDAEAQAAATLAQAREKAAASCDLIQSDAEKAAAAIAEKTRSDVEEIHRRRLLVAGLEGRKNALAARREVLDEAFSMALDELCALPEDRWAALIVRLAADAAETGTETICVPAADREKYRSDFFSQLQTAMGQKGSVLDAINAELVRAGKQGALKLSETPANIRGGFLLVGEKADVNCSFEALVRQERELCEKEAAALLFGAEVK